MTTREEVHWGRAWSGHEIEDACPCPKAACGLVSTADPECPQHGQKFARTSRQAHYATECPAQREAPTLTTKKP